MRTSPRGAPAPRAAARTARRTVGVAAAALLIAVGAAATASAKDTQILLEVTGDELVLVGGTHTLDVTATKTADDPGNPIGCVELVAPPGWGDPTIVAGVQPASGWSADDGPPATWSADTGDGKLQDLGEAAEVRVSAVAPMSAGTGTWTVRLYDSVTCADTPMLATTFDVDVVTSAAELTIAPASATVTAGDAHQVAFTAGWLASAGDEIGCIAVTLPAGWTGLGTTGTGTPAGWSGDVTGQVATWTADTAGAVLDATGDAASFTVTATSPDATGGSDWTAAVFAATDCTGQPLLTGTAAVTLEAAPVTPEATLALTPDAATIVVGTDHAVDVVATWVAGEGGIGCVVVTLPAGWTGLALSAGLPAGWSGVVDEAAGTATWAADTGGDRLNAPGDAASFTLGATGPATVGTADWDAAAYASRDCADEPILTGTAAVTLTAAPTGDDGGDGGDGDAVPDVLAADPPVLAADPPVPGAIPAGEDPSTPGTGPAAVLVGLAAAAAAGATALRRRSAAVPGRPHGAANGAEVAAR